MRRSLSFILVMLLVLRGLLGDAMAMGTVPAGGYAPSAVRQADEDMAVVHQVANVLAAHWGSADAPAPHSVPHHDGHHHTAATVDPELLAHDDCATPAHSAPANGTACCHDQDPSCSACGICHSALYQLDPPLPGHGLAFRTPPLQRGASFVSAPAALAIKPPIL